MLLHSPHISSKSSSSSTINACTAESKDSGLCSTPTTSAYQSSHYHGIKSHSVSGTSSPHDPIPRRYSLAIETPSSHSKHPNTPFSAWLVQSLTGIPKRNSVTDLTEFDKVLETAQDCESPSSPINPIHKRLSVSSDTSNDSLTFNECNSRGSGDGWSQSTTATQGHNKHHRCNSTAIKFNTPQYR